MNFFKILIIIFYLLLTGISVQADNHDTEQNIIEKAKEINQKVKKQQALKEAGMLPNDAGTEEPLPLNDPFVGDGSLGGGSGIKVVAETDEEKRNLSVFNFKLVGIVEGEDESYASMVNEDGDVLTLAAFEEIAPGVPLICPVFDVSGVSVTVCCPDSATADSFGDTASFPCSFPFPFPVPFPFPDLLPCPDPFTCPSLLCSGRRE